MARFRAAAMDYLVSYGSLISRESRERHSNIFVRATAVQLFGWRRHWGARYEDEAATYAAAVPEQGAQLHAALLPIRMTEELRYRERGYDFIEIDHPEAVLLDYHTQSKLRQTGRFWIAKAKSIQYASANYPLPQSYVDTCLHGCLEIASVEFARSFLAESVGWEGAWINDRDQKPPVFPRNAEVNKDDKMLIDEITKECGILKFRMP